MGYLIVMIVGAILGWLAAIVVDRDDRVNTITCTMAGMIGGVVAALAAGDISLGEGVSAPQLLWSVGGAVAAIIVVNAPVRRRSQANPGSV